MIVEETLTFLQDGDHYIAVVHTEVYSCFYCNRRNPDGSCYEKCHYKTMELYERKEQ